MFGVLFLYFIGKYFFKLAEDNNQNKWLYAILSIIIFYVGSFFGGIFLGIIFLLIDFDFDWNDEKANSIIALPFGFLADYLFYIILKKKWQIKIKDIDEIQDIGKKSE
jgi:hypothetical protein